MTASADSPLQTQYANRDPPKHPTYSIQFRQTKHHTKYHQNRSQSTVQSTGSPSMDGLGDCMKCPELPTISGVPEMS